ncbi:hypothetical protein QLG10_08185, partial [Pseudomonas sp. V98_8]|uniref:hypothetical protein n=1 Tax=Pseudomonas sp. V98_8 TaxID=3044228 RepID=UPI00249F0EF5
PPRRYAPTPRMNTSTQPAEGAGRSRSRAEGELTLGLMSGEKRVYASLLFCRSWLASDGGLTADPSLADVLDLL